jgi:hypothetical protein
MRIIRGAFSGTSACSKVWRAGAANAAATGFGLDAASAGPVGLQSSSTTLILSAHPSAVAPATGRELLRGGHRVVVMGGS